MGDCRIPGPTCRSRPHYPVDEGTTCSQASQPPTCTGNALPRSGALRQERGSYVDDYDSAYYDIDYRSNKGSLSKWMRLKYSDGAIADVSIDDVVDECTTDETTEKLKSRSHIGDARRIFPWRMNPQTTPRVWEAKQSVLRIMDDYNALFILGTFPALWLILTAGIGTGPGRVLKSSRTAIPRQSLPGAGDGAAAGEGTAAATPKAVAQKLLSELVSKGKRVIVNIGGTGAPHEPGDGINLNPNLPGVARKDIPNLVKAYGEEIGEVFPPNSVHEIQGHNLAPTVLDWRRVAPGAYKVLVPGGKFQIYFRGAHPEDTSHLAEALRAAGFRDIKVISDVVIQAQK